ncbi:MAG: DNA-processing protein DprA [Spirochaetaceae bacterium]
MTAIPVTALAIHRIMSLRCAEKEALFEAAPEPAVFSTLSSDRISTIVGRVLRARIPDPAALLRAAAQDVQLCRALGATIVPVWSSDYPPLLRETFDPPFLLFVRGALPATALPQCAVVGTRNPGEKALRETRRFARDLANSCVPVVSGLATGVDGEAHRGAVNAHGHTTGVLGSGIDVVYPVSHRRLAARILDGGGLILSEYPPGTPPLKHHFPQRNRIISGLSRWVVIMEAPERSGALITADYALDQGRELCVHAVGASAHPGAAGTRALLSEGARCVRRADDLYDVTDTHAFAGYETGTLGGSRKLGSGRNDVAGLLSRSLQEELRLSEAGRDQGSSHGG